jgi:hypothetical protein
LSDKPAYKQSTYPFQMKFQFHSPDFCLSFSHKPSKKSVETKICREVEYVPEPVSHTPKKHVRYGEKGAWTATYDRVPAIPVSKDGWLPKGSIHS